MREDTIYRMYFSFSQAEMRNGLKSVGTICYRAYGSYCSVFQCRKLDKIYFTGISIPVQIFAFPRASGSITYSRVGFQSHAKN